MILSKFCVRNPYDHSDHNCTQCRCRFRSTRKRECSVYRMFLRQAPSMIERLRMENEDLLAQAKFLRAELVEANQMLFRLGYTQSQQARVN
jgi:hypothetical protein